MWKPNILKYTILILLVHIWKIGLLFLMKIYLDNDGNLNFKTKLLPKNTTSNIGRKPFEISSEYECTGPNVYKIVGFIYIQNIENSIFSKS